MTEHSKGRVIVTASGAIITSRLIGDISTEIVKKSMKELHEHAIKIRASGRKPSLMVVLSRVTSQANEVTSEAKLLNEFNFEKIAIAGGNGLLLATAHYIVKTGGMGKYTHFFRTERKAKLWLKGRERESVTFYEKSKFVSAGLIILLAVSAIIGWSYDNALLKAIVSNLKSMNPMVGVTLVILALSLLLINRTTYKSKVKKIGLLIAATWSVFFGFSVLLRHYTNTDVGIDLLLFPERLEALGAFSGRASYSGGLLSILAGSTLAFFALSKKPWWILYLFYTISFGMFAIVFAAAIGYAFGIAILYEWTNQLPTPINTVIAFGILNFTLASLMKPIPVIAWAKKKIQSYWQALLVFLILVIATGVVMQQLQSDNTKTINNSESEVFLKTENNIRSSLASYSTVLSGFKGFFNSSADITPEEFRAYYLNSGINSGYAGFIAIAHAASVKESELNKFIAKARSRTSTTFPAYASYRIYQADTAFVSQIHYPILYAEPSLPTTPYGFDVNTEQVRRTALERASELNSAIISDVIDLNASVRVEGQPYIERPGFFIALSLDDAQIGAQSRTSTTNSGFVFAYFQSDLLFANIFKNSSSDDARYSLTDSSSGKIVHSTTAKNVGINAKTKKSTIITIGGREWELNMATSPNFAVSSTAQRAPGIVLFGGLLVALLGAGLVVVQLRRRDQALSLAENMTMDLNNERNLAIAARNKDEAILSSIGDAVFAIDTDQRITLFNSVSEKITGYSAEEVIGKPYNDFLIFADDKTHTVNNNFIEKALAGKNSSMDGLTVLKRKNGSYVYVADSAAPIRNSSGQLLGAIIVFRDITNEQALDRAKTEFVSLASHQLRTPLSAINWYSEILLNGDAGKLTENQITYVKEIFDGNQRMIELVNSLLNVSRLDLGKLDNVPTDVSTVELIESLEKEMTPLIVQKNIAIKKNISHSPAMSIEPNLIRMIIQNILSNAIKYTPDGGTVHITATQATHDEVLNAHIHSTEPHIVLKVQDTGYGIPEDQQAKIFTKMFRADNARVLDVEGTGLGLYIVKEVVKKLHGRVWFESIENKGTTFHIILPVKTKPTKL